MAKSLSPQDRPSEIAMKQRSRTINRRFDYSETGAGAGDGEEQANKTKFYPCACDLCVFPGEGGLHVVVSLTSPSSGDFVTEVLLMLLAAGRGRERTQWRPWLLPNNRALKAARSAVLSQSVLLGGPRTFEGCAPALRCPL